jgi:hypothetical protein
MLQVVRSRGRVTVQEIEVYVDGANQSVGKSEIEKSFQASWHLNYESTYGSVVFKSPLDLKTSPSGHPRLDAAADVRNPDLFYWSTVFGPLLGVEITTHSPDGSNIEKRYPFLWASRREGITAFVATPYLKVRPGGQVNRLPYRHSMHNNHLAEAWSPDDPNSSLQQLLPVADLMGGDLRTVQADLRKLLWSWDKVGIFLAHRMAQVVSNGENSSSGRALEQMKRDLIGLAKSCMQATTHTSASTLYMDNSRWIQVFNCRPETGWWERGEGQFDSIDGRVMFTLSEIDFRPSAERPEQLELWLPQMTTKHPWIQEQVAAGYGSKRFRNLAQLLPSLAMNVKFKLVFADQLSVRDWTILEVNPIMCLERLVSPTAELLRIGDFVTAFDAAQVSEDAKHSPSDVRPIHDLITNGDVHVATSRAYAIGWEARLAELLTNVAAETEIFVPRVPQALLSKIRTPEGIRLHGGEDCGRPLLLLLRYLHRHGRMPG